MDLQICGARRESQNPKSVVDKQPNGKCRFKAPMKHRLNTDFLIRIARILESICVWACFCFAGFLLAGCCSMRCADCIPHRKMPYVLYDKGVKYYLTDHVSINQMIDAEVEENSIQKNWQKTLREKFPNDKELMAYLDLRQKRLDERDKKSESRHDSFEDFLWDMKDDLEQSGGELYYYKIVGKKIVMDNGQPGVESVEEGYLILSRGSVLKKLVAGYGGIESEDLLREEGIN
jgi:hypothetical protein